MLITQRSSIPPISQRDLRTNGPRTIAPKADPTSRKPTIPFTPEQAETTLSGKGWPAWLTVKIPFEADLATGRTRVTAAKARRVRFVKELRSLSNNKV